MREVKVGVVGLGRFGRLHTRILSELPGCEVSALCEVHEPTLGRFGEEYGVEALYTDLEAMLGSEDLDAVDVVTDESAHGSQAISCLEHGKAVFVEKPLATNGEEAEAVVRKSRDTGLPVVVGNISRFDARYAILRRELEAGRFGRVSLVQAKRSFSRAWFAGFGSRVHPVFESMIHDLDLALWYLPSPVRRVYAQAHSTGDEDGVPNTLVATLTAEDGALAVLQSTWLVPDAAPITLVGPPAGPLDLWGTIDAQLEVVGTSQVGKVDLMASGFSLWDDSGTRTPDTGLWPEVHGRVSGALREELSHFLDCVRTGKRSHLAPPETGAVAVRLAEAIVRSSREDKIVLLPEAGDFQ
ncbi:MAG: Gfo/Idh/MocA family oxidoreductase [Actinobacteria bacterium]|nr:Gfo/Idh/MocA family oxidoreductase [Actinomycetota bacterium]